MNIHIQKSITFVKKRTWLRRIFVLSSIVILLIGLYFLIGFRFKPQSIQYGVSFNTPYARELGLDWKQAYRATLDDLGVKHLRLAAHWNMVEPKNNEWNFRELDYQVKLAEDRGAQIVFAVGRRLPRWPECHEPDWVKELSWREHKREIKEYIEKVVTRYKDSSAITYWQVENEPYLTVFAKEHCGEKLDVDFLKEEIALVKELDSSRPVLVTDSGNLGLWAGPYRNGDAFGTSVYVYLWNPDIGPFRSFLAPHFYRFKAGLMQILFTKKEVMLIELAAEPWLLQPIVETDLPTQFKRMNINKFREIIEFAERTRFEKQYLWGVEWWYYLKQQGDERFWNEARKLFNSK